jgi:hypothetical protein
VDAVVEDTDPEDWHAREVFAHFGLAMYTAQVLEHGIINLASWTSIQDRTIRTLTESEADSVKLFRQTMGALKTTLMVRRADIRHLDDLLVRSVQLRNFLAHEYFRQRAAAFMTEDGKDQMIEELGRAVAFFQEIDSKLDSLTAQILSATGVDKHMPEAMEAARQQGFRDPLPGL